jgi:hypothetical protein
MRIETLPSVQQAESPPCQKRWFRSGTFWLLLAVFGFEFLLFDRFGARRHTGIYPRWDDQVQYLSESYIAYELARTDGFGAGLRHAVFHPSAQGTLHDVGALLAFELAGPSRSAALALNLLALIAWQSALFVAVKRACRHGSVAFAAAMLPLALVGPWENIPGSAYDFRLDHFAMCALGVTSALAWLTSAFSRRAASIVFGVATALTLLTRFLTGTFLLLIFMGLATWILLRRAPDRRARFVNLGLAALVALVLAGPIMWLSRERVLDYYWIGHFVGAESAVRDAHLNLIASASFVFRHLGERHLGIFFGSMAALGAVGFALARGARRPLPEGAWSIGLFFLLAPAVVFTLHRQKSEVVVIALVPGALLLVVALWLRALGSPGANSKIPSRIALVLSCAILVFFAQRQLRPAYDPPTLAHIRTVNTLADSLFTRVTHAKIPEPGIAVDHINDALHAEVLRVIFYERHRVWLPIKMTLPTGVVEPSADDVMARLARSYLVILTDEPAPGGGYPYDQKLAAMRPQLRAWCGTNLIPVEHFTLFGRSMILYQRPDTPSR